MFKRIAYSLLFSLISTIPILIKFFPYPLLDKTKKS